jgi:inosine-uridine nucleoside N-ribohydrolase
MKIIIDTDVGTDCDDLFALAYAMTAMKSGKIDIKAITTVSEKNQVRAKIVRKLERILGLDLPIISGTLAGDRSYVKNGVARSIYCGFEHLALSEKELAEPLKQFPEIAYEKGDRLVGIGPLTSIAEEMNKNPSLRNVEEIYLMGLNEDSHNFKVDSEATRRVLTYDWKKYLVTSKISENVVITCRDMEQLRGSELAEFLADSAVRWLDFSGKKQAKMYDVLAVSAAMDEGYVRFSENCGNSVSDYVNPELKEKLLGVVKNAS